MALRVDVCAPRILAPGGGFGVSGVAFGTQRIIFRPLGVNFLTLDVDVGYLRVDFSLGGEFRLPCFDFRPLRVHYGPLGDNFWPL